MKYRLFAFALLIFSLSACKSYYNVVSVKDNQPILDATGYYYSLPQNIISIDVRVVKTEHIVGPYAEYASKYLGLKNVRLENSTSFEMTDFKINTHSEPDPNHFYFVDLSNLKEKSKELMLKLSEGGLIQDVNDDSDEIVKSEQKEYQKIHKIDYSRTFKYFADNNLIEQIDTIVKLVNVDTMLVEKQVLKKSMVEKSIEQKAKEAADYISKLRNQQFDVITGMHEIAYSGETMQFMYEELKKLENEYMTMFTGIENEVVYNYRYYYLPEAHVYSASVPLFKFSKIHGVQDIDYNIGETVYVQVDRATNTELLSQFNNNIERSEDSPKGFYYRIPEYAKFTIIHGKTLKAEVKLLVSQFGVVANLPANVNKIQFYPNTGALRKVVILEED